MWFQGDDLETILSEERSNESKDPVDFSNK